MQSIVVEKFDLLEEVHGESDLFTASFSFFQWSIFFVPWVPVLVVFRGAARGSVQRVLSVPPLLPVARLPLPPQVKEGTMDEVIVIENTKRIRVDTGDVRKELSTRVHPEIRCTERDWGIMQSDQNEVIVMSDDSDPGVYSQNSVHAPVVLPQGSFTERVEGKTYMFQNGMKSLDHNKEFLQKKTEVHKSKKRTLHTPGDKNSSSSSSRNIGYTEGKAAVSEATERDDPAATIRKQEETSVSPVIYNFENPLMAMNYSGEFKTSEDNFTKGCKWSPDGSCLLVAANDSRLRLFNLPTPVLQGEFHCESWFAEEAEKYSTAAVTVREKELIYDYCWYPLMRSDLPSTCCLAATCRDQPIHLWDAWDGHLICSYHSFNHLDEMVAAYSVGFNLDGSRMVAGFSKCLRTFHTHRPGRYFEQIEAKNQPGIISCTSFNPQLPSVFAAGSYLGSIGLYNLERNNLFCRIDGDIGGVTQVKFSSCGTKLFSGSRKNNEILCWDIRNPGTLLCSYKREVSTNQRIYFDLEPHFSSFLVSGDTGGRVLKWDLDKGWEAASEGEESTIEPSSAFVAHKDCSNGVSIHPYCPLLATSSGQRHFPEPVSGSDLDSSSETEEPKALFTSRRIFRENTVKLWWLAGS